MTQNETIWNIQRVLEWTQGHFEAKGVAQGRLEAQWMVCAATGLSRIELYTNYDQPLDAAQLALVREGIKRRLAGEPLQYIVGRAAFRRLEFIVRAPVLIPRPETEVLVGLVLENLGAGAHHGNGEDTVEDNGEDAGDGPACLAACSELGSPTLPRVLDIGTGTGCIALSLLHEAEAVRLVATDIDAAAVALATENAEILGLLDPERLSIVQDDLAGSLVADPGNHGSFDVVVSNPPYIPSAEIEGLSAEVAQFESRIALDGGPDGLVAFRKIVEQAAVLLIPGGLLACELHEDCLEAAAEYCLAQGLVEVAIHKDLAGKPRIIVAHTARN